MTLLPYLAAAPAPYGPATPGSIPHPAPLRPHALYLSCSLLLSLGGWWAAGSPPPVPLRQLQASHQVEAPEDDTRNYIELFHEGVKQWNADCPPVNLEKLNMMDWSWMSRRVYSGRVTQEFKDGVDEFIAVATSNPLTMEGDKILYPCTICKNKNFLIPDLVMVHLYKKGFVQGYQNWTLHGEPFWRFDDPHHVSAEGGGTDLRNPYMDMVMDGTRRADMTYDAVNDFNETSNPSAARFYKLLKDADEPLWEGCKAHTRLSAT